MAKKSYICSTCGVLAEEPGHLCSPSGGDGTCDFCGEKAPEKKHFCRGKLDNIKYACEQCGRLSTSANLLCQPTDVPNA